MTPAPQIVLSVPGAWRSRESIALAIADRTRGKYILSNGLLETPGGEHWVLDIVDYNPRLRDAFAEASANTFSEDLLNLIDNHSFTLSLIAPTGNDGHVKRVMEAGRALLEAGGMAITVTSSGIAHSADQWNQLCEGEAPGCFIDAFVETLEKDAHTYLSIGMHNLSLPDAWLQGDTHPARAGLLVGRFLRYLIENRPDFHEGEFFRFDENEAPYRLSRRQPSEFLPGDLYHNPLGYWQLELAEIN